VVDVDAGAVVDGHDLLQADVEAVADRIGAGLDQRIAAAELCALDAGQAHRDALPGLGNVDSAVVHLDGADADVEAGWLDTQRRARADRARPERPRRDRADAAQRERAIDEEARRPVRVYGCRLVRRGGERCAELVEALSGLRARGDDGRIRDELAGLLQRQLQGLLVHGIRLRHRDDAMVDAEQPDDGQVLVRLRSRALAGVDDEQEEVDAGRSRDHRVHEALMPRHVHERQATPVREVERGVAELDRDPALLLLRQPVRVLSRQRPHEPRLAVVNVPRRSDRLGHRAAYYSAIGLWSNFNDRVPGV
jgi:hypothetical protein